MKKRPNRLQTWGSSSLAKKEQTTHSNTTTAPTSAPATHNVHRDPGSSAAASSSAVAQQAPSSSSAGGGAWHRGPPVSATPTTAPETVSKEEEDKKHSPNSTTRPHHHQPRGGGRGVNTDRNSSTSGACPCAPLPSSVLPPRTIERCPFKLPQVVNLKAAVLRKTPWVDFSGWINAKKGEDGKEEMRKKEKGERGDDDDTNAGSNQQQQQKYRHLYIGRDMTKYIPEARGSKWGNPFAVGNKKYPTTEDRVVAFMAHIKGTPELYDALEELLEYEEIGCWCDPSPCHGHALCFMLYEKLMMKESSSSGSQATATAVAASKESEAQ